VRTEVTGPTARSSGSSRCGPRSSSAPCSELGIAPGPHRERAAALTAAPVRRLWSPEAGQFLCRDLRAEPREPRHGGALLDVRSVAGLLPLIAPGLPADITAALLRTITSEHFGLGTSVRLLPSYDLRGPAFDPYRYWRGPAWFNVNWLLEHGLRRRGETERADALRADVLDAGRPRPASRSTSTRTPVAGREPVTSAGPPRSPSICSKGRIPPSTAN